ncbi:inhibitor of nuclear factor kappa-B kinase-interacting protein isoform X1 [Callorhinchus milii]|uniref:Inhibitor of nuclear factor kappa-B kinase-interacting protein n=2 Tax=Callorhinchus milii TaxID=7868 RepID=A0A4W3IN73_CALMI|nr:inhibitor of nuclear factor kappa-B kinase-interacting protein isoform X1 [Callorhinchus milii]|eukprot:gi/632978426/ref/XP_007905908.1/ PREDICTED: inhibitor of nuclear factor kappa-B kinase-interacting protein isoform X1 [Callorhinchus milii]
MSAEIKPRKRSAAVPGQSGGARAHPVTAVAEQPERGRCRKDSPRRPHADVRTALCVLSLLASAALGGLIFQQAAKFADVEEKYQLLYMKSLAVQDLKKEISKISEKCEKSQENLDKFKGQSLMAQIEDLQIDVNEMKSWSFSITEKRNEMYEKIVLLTEAIEKIGNSTAYISNDVTTKISGIRTDMRRTSGLDSDVVSLKESLLDLENKATEVEKMFILKIGDLVIKSVEQITQIKKALSKNTEEIKFVQKKMDELKAKDDTFSDRFVSLENSRAKLIKTVTFANDLKPKVFHLKKDLSVLESHVNDLIGRIGQLSSALLKKNEEIAVLNKQISNCTVIPNDVKDLKDQLDQVTEMG